MRGVRTVVGVAVAGTVLCFAGGASGAATMPVGGPVAVFVTPSKDGIHGPIVMTGAIGDYGQTTTMDKDGKPDSNGNYVKIALKKGTFQIDATALNAKADKARPTIDKATCSFAASATGPVTLSAGTGLYTGVSGTISITVTFAGIGPLTQAGKCNLSNNAKPVAEYSSISGRGMVKFS